MPYRLVLICVLTFAISASVATTAGAQGTPATVAVSSEVREVGEKYFGGYLQVYADGQLCGELSFSDPARRTPDGGAEFELGGAGQPAACTRSGATISFFDGNFVALGNRYTLAPGARIEISWLRIGQPRQGLDEGPSADGRTYLTIDPLLREGGAERLGYLEVFADDEPCGSFSFTDTEQFTSSGGAEFELSAPGQSGACGRDGAIITLRYPSGIRLSAVYRLTTGQRIAIQNFTIPPPHTGDNGGTAPGAPEAGAGVVPDPSRSAPQTALAIGTLLLLVGVMLYVVSRRHALRQ